MRLVLMGSPALALPGFQALLRAGHEIAAVYTQPDRPKGRGRKVQACAVAAWAREEGLRVEQPRTFRGEEVRQVLRDTKPDCLVVTAYGRILPRGVLAIPRLGAVNVHASLLPRWRGASPIQSAIAAGDRETGLTLIQMDAGLDTGPMLAQELITIAPRDSSITLGQRMMELSGPMLLETLDRLATGEVQASPQGEEGLCFAPILSKDDGQRHWTDSAQTLDRLVRAYDPWPGVTLPVADLRIKILRGRSLDSEGVEAPGTVLSIDDGSVVVSCAEGWFSLEQVQAPSRRACAADDWARGAHLAPGARLV